MVRQLTARDLPPELVMFRPTAGDIMHTSALARIRAAPVTDSLEDLPPRRAAGPSVEAAAGSSSHGGLPAAATDPAAEQTWQLVGPRHAEQAKPGRSIYEAPHKPARHRGQRRDPVGAALGTAWALGNIATLLLLGWIANGQLGDQGSEQSPSFTVGSSDLPSP